MSLNESPAAVRERLEQEAVAWYVRLASGEMSQEERQQFESWRHISPAHRQADHKIAKLWDMLDVVMEAAQALPSTVEAASDKHSADIISLADARQQLSEAKTAQTRRVSKTGIFTRWSLGLATAASVLILVGTMLCYSGICVDNLYHPMADYHTMTGEQKTIHLADGSTLYLNTDTALDVELSEHERRIVLIQGEAEFQVAHDKSKPFRVVAGSTTTEALGTQFMVRYNDNEGLITLIEGKVRTSTHSGNRSLTLKPGDQLAFTVQQLGELHSTDLASAEAWRRGRLVMNFVSLQDVVNEINRYRHGHVHILDSALSQRKIHVAIDIKHIDDWLNALDDSLPVRVRRLGPVVLLQGV